MVQAGGEGLEAVDAVGAEVRPKGHRCPGAVEPAVRPEGVHRLSRNRSGQHLHRGVNSATRAAIAHEIRFWSKARSGRFVSPMSLHTRIGASQRVWRRCRNSRSGSWVLGPPVSVLFASVFVLVPSTSVIVSCAPGGDVACG